MTAVFLLIGVRNAAAQVYESVGIRAQGMAGAFVGLADDATATWWNPAGLAGGPFFNGLLELQGGGEPADERDSSGKLRPAWGGKTFGVVFAFPSLGLSYYHLRHSEIQPFSPTAPPTPDRLDQRPGDVRLRTLTWHQFGATVGQSFGDHMSIASTLKLLHGGLGAALRSDAAASLDAASDLSASAETHVDLDVGVLASWGPWRAGAAVKNIVRPEFGKGLERLALPRQARVGVSASTNRTSQGAGATFAADVDLTKTSIATRERRHVAVGAETWTASRRYAVRGGVSVNTVGEARPTASVGGTVGLPAGFLFDVVGTLGSDTASRGFGVGLRVTFR